MAPLGGVGGRSRALCRSIGGQRHGRSRDSGDVSRNRAVTTLQAEVATYIEAHADLPDANCCRLVVRNGHLQPREVTTAAGAVPVRALGRRHPPQGPARSEEGCLLVMIGVRADGRKELIALADGLRKSCWRSKTTGRALDPSAHQEPDQVDLRDRPGAPADHQGTRLPRHRGGDGVQAHRVHPVRPFLMGRPQPGLPKIMSTRVAERGR
jgi:hypothetical protein